MLVKLMFYDAETTGLYPSRCAIHQLSGRLVICDTDTPETMKLLWEFNYHIKPHEGAHITPEALAVSNTNADAMDAYPEHGVVFREFVTELSKHVDRYNKQDKIFLVGYNINGFDNAFMRAWFLRNGDKYFGSYFWTNSIDLYPIASLRLLSIRPSMPDFKLATVCRYLGVPVNPNKLHDAVYDIGLCLDLYKKLAFMFWIPKESPALQSTVMKIVNGICEKLDIAPPVRQQMNDGFDSDVKQCIIDYVKEVRLG